MRRLTTKEECLVSCIECEEREGCERYCYKINEPVKKLMRYEDIGLIPNQVKELQERDTAQKPKEQKQHKDFHGNVYKITGECPVCGNGVNNQMRFCDSCGKRLSWIPQDKIAKEVIENNSVSTKTYLCPVCKRTVIKGNNYCGNCGQKLNTNKIERKSQ